MRISDWSSDVCSSDLIHGEFLKALGTPSLFTTLSIDQSAKAIAACRMGYWHAGRNHIDDSDVAILFGSNPLISHSAGGFLVSDPVKRVKRAVERGLRSEEHTSELQSLMRLSYAV